MKICIDAGHGGKDPGAVSGKVFEKDIVLSISLLLADILKKRDIEVCLTRNTDIYHTVNEKARIANKSKADLFISIHCNSAASVSSNGTEVLIWDNDGKADILAEDMLDSLVDGLILRDRGVKVRKDLAVLNSTDMTAVLVETAFISNDADRKKLTERQKDFAQAIASGVFKYLGLEEYVVDKIEISLNGKIKKVEAINHDGFNYVKLRDLADDKINVGYDNSKALPVVGVK